MLSPTTTTTSAAAATSTASYTTIPISGDDVISRSIQNLSDTVSRHRPWSEFIAAGVFDSPESLSAAGLRLQKNSKYFSINYAILISICAAFSVLLTPISLIAYAAVFALWLVLVFFREDPMVAWGYHVSDRIVIGGLVLVSAMAIWFAGLVNYLLIGVAVGLLISAVHGALRNPDGLFLDEEDAVSDGLIGANSNSNSNSNPQRKDFWN
ncbi:hypothetical protein ACSBR2_010986 [Camellia fascicularis]